MSSQERNKEIVTVNELISGTHQEILAIIKKLYINGMRTAWGYSPCGREALIISNTAYFADDMDALKRGMKELFPYTYTIDDSICYSSDSDSSSDDDSN